LRERDEEGERSTDRERERRQRLRGRELRKRGSIRGATTTALPQRREIWRRDKCSVFSPFFLFIGDNSRTSLSRYESNPDRFRLGSDSPNSTESALNQSQSGFDSDLLNHSGIRVISDHAESDMTTLRPTEPLSHKNLK